MFQYLPHSCRLCDEANQAHPPAAPAAPCRYAPNFTQPLAGGQRPLKIGCRRGLSLQQTQIAQLESTRAFRRKHSLRPAAADCYRLACARSRDREVHHTYRDFRHSDYASCIKGGCTDAY